jgi:hypothetical protein
MNQKPNMGEIRNWAIIFHEPYGYVICGECDLVRDEGNFIRTSPIISISIGQVETLNSIYTLIGLPSKQKHDQAQEIYNLRYNRN